MTSHVERGERAMLEPPVKMLVADDAHEIRFLFWRTMRQALPPIELIEASTGLECRQFDVAIAGRTISLRHKPTGHVYEYLWFRDAPHLRLGQVRENFGAQVPPRQIRADARHAAILELKQARLLDAVAA
jgi:hypothetical protein